MRLLLANTIGRVGNWVLSLADRDVCRWAQDTDEDES